VGRKRGEDPPLPLAQKRWRQPSESSCGWDSRHGMDIEWSLGSTLRWPMWKRRTICSLNVQMDTPQWVCGGDEATRLVCGWDVEWGALAAGPGCGWFWGALGELEKSLSNQFSEFNGTLALCRSLLRGGHVTLPTGTGLGPRGSHNGLEANDSATSNDFCRTRAGRNH